MSRASSLDTYRWVKVDHPVAWRIVGPNGKQNERLCGALSAALDELDNEKLAKRYCAALAYALSRAEERVRHAADVLMRSVNEFRRLIKAFLKAARIGRRVRAGVEWVTPPQELHSKVSDALAVLGKIGEAAAERLFGGTDPSMRPATSKRRDKYDKGRLFRLPTNPGHAPRHEDPRMWDRWRRGLEDIGAPVCYIAIGDVARFAGKRRFQVRELTLHDVLVSPGKGFELMFGSKGARDRHDEKGLLPRGAWYRLLAYIDGERAELTGLGLEDLRRMARDPRQMDALRVPVFTEDGVNPLDDNRMYRVFRKAAEKADLFFDDQAYRGSGGRVKRYVTFHYLRHEYVHCRLDAIMGLEERDYRQKKRALIAYMNWSSGEAMLRWYSHHHVVKYADAAVTAYNDAIDDSLQDISAPVERVVVAANSHDVDHFNAELT